MGGLFPGFRWRGAYLAPSLFIHPSKSISMDATTLQNIMVGANQDFIAGKASKKSIQFLLFVSNQLSYSILLHPFLQIIFLG